MSLRVLLLDDNPDDRVLALRELEREFPGLRARQVADRPGFEAALEEAGFDIVITDFQMRWSTGLEVLERVKTRWPGLPVIMFTATGTQEIAVQAMKSGLDDYVIKSARHYVRLAVAVRGCLDRNEIRLRAIRSETRLQSLLEHTRVGVFRLTLDGELQDLNRSMRAMLALGDEAGLGEATHPLLDTARELARGLARRGDTAEREVVVVGDAAGDCCVEADHAPGSAHYYALKVVRVPVNGHDAIDGLVDDATPFRRADRALLELNRTLERRVDERTRQLSEANESLEAFGYSVSHDLREPVRTIQGYTRALREDFAAARLDDVPVFLARIDTIAQRIDQMVSDLFEYSKLSSAELQPSRIDLGAALDEAQAQLAFEPAFQRADLRRSDEPWPPVSGHGATVVQVFANLLSNAAKFVPGRNEPHIGVRAVRRGDVVRVEVADNGIGIAAGNRGRIFEVFHRLHGQESYPGTGIGLALVRKGIERMGGQVGVDSEPGAGSVFWFELPAA